ncbi:MAG: hypothetical protein RL735_1338 [Pseudomonadota bacterium]|jgi:uncharacterized small protein (DUF1192 family)
MAMPEDDDPFAPRRPKKPATHEIGQSIDTLTADELSERIGLLHSEIERLEAARLAREASRRAADAFFKS